MATEPLELHCSPDDRDEALAAAAQSLGVDATPRRRAAQTLLLAEVGRRESEAVLAAVTARGLQARLVAAPPRELGKAWLLVLLILFTRNVAAILGPSYERYGAATLMRLGPFELVVWVLVAVLVALLARRFFGLDVVPRWRRPPPMPRTMDASTEILAWWAALAAALHACLSVHAALAGAVLDLSSTSQLALILAGDLLAMFAYGILYLMLLARGGATGAARCLSMLVVAYAVDLAMTALAAGRGMTTFPWYGVPILHLAVVAVGYQLLRALVLAVLYLGLGYGLLRAAGPTPALRAMAAGAFVAGAAFATLSQLGPAGAAVFDITLAVFLVPRPVPRPRALASG